MWICSGESATLLFWPPPPIINSVIALTAEIAENQISFDISVANSPEEINKSSEQSNIWLEEI